MMKTASVTTRCRPADASRAALFAFMAAMMLSQVGCLGFAANLMHAVGADMVPAKFSELEDSSVAVVTSTESSHYKDDVAAQILSKSVGAILTQEVKKVRLVRHSEIDQWRDRVGWETVDFIALGKAVEADKVVAIDLNNLKLREGSTLYRGSADVVVTVYDVASGTVVYSQEIDDYTYPRTAGQHVSETTEARFRKAYLGMLSKEVGRAFHPYDFSDTFALDGAIASQ